MVAIINIETEEAVGYIDEPGDYNVNVREVQNFLDSAHENGVGRKSGYYEEDDDTDGTEQEILMPDDEGFMRTLINRLSYPYMPSVEIDKQAQIPYEDRQYIDSPDDAPGDVQVHEGDQEDTWFYDITEVEKPDEYDEQEWKENIQEYSGVEEGDIVEYYSQEDNEVYEGEITGTDADERGAYYEITFEDGSSVWTSLDNVKVKDPVAPEEGEKIPLEEYEPGDKISYIRWGDIVEHTVSQMEGDTIYVIDENGREVSATSTEHRARRTDTSENASARDLALTTTIDSKRDFRENEIRPILGEAVGQIKGDEISKTVAGHVDTVEYNQGDRNAWHAGEQKLMFDREPDTDVVAHEYGHVLADSHGYDTDPEDKGINLVARFSVEDIVPIEFGERFGDALLTALERLEEARTDFEVTDGIRDTLDGDSFDDTINREDFLLTKQRDEESPEEIDNLIDQVNETWEEVVDLAGEGEYAKADVRCPLRPYAASNAHEMLATVSQIAQSTTGDEAHLRTVWEFHPDLLEAYLDVYEPSDPAKEMLNSFHDHESMEDVFQEKPYPEVEEDED